MSAGYLRPNTDPVRRSAFDCLEAMKRRVAEIDRLLRDPYQSSTDDFLLVHQELRALVEKLTFENIQIPLHTIDTGTRGDKQRGDHDEVRPRLNETFNPHI